MAQTAAAVQAVLGTNPMNAQIITSFQPSLGTTQQWYCIGNVDAPGRARFIETTASDDAATQAADILTALRA